MLPAPRVWSDVATTIGGSSGGLSDLAGWCGREVAGGPMVRPELNLGGQAGANSLHLGTAGTKDAAARWIDLARQVAAHGLAGRLASRIRRRDRADERLGIGMAGASEDRRRRAQLYDAPQIHDRDAGAEVLDHTQIMGNEDHGKAERIPEVYQQVQHLSLDRDVEAGNGFVSHQHGRPYGKRPRDCRALSLAAGKLEGVALGIIGRESDLRQ